MSFSSLRLVLGLSLALSLVLAQEGTQNAVPATPPGDSQQEGGQQEVAPDPAPAEEGQDADIAPPAAVQRTVPENAEPLSNLTLRRDDRTIFVNQYAPGAEGGQFVLLAPDCDEEAKKNKLRTSTVYGGDAYLVETLVNETRITSAIVFQKSPPKEEGGNDKAMLEMLGGTLTVNDEGCPEAIEPSGQQDVKLEQGRTTVDGYQGVYDNETGVFEMSGGPVKLSRIAEGDSPALSADAGSLTYNEATDQIVLTKDVSIESDGRVSEADSVEFDDDNSIAILKGNPATSRKGDEFFQGNVITYYLDSNDVKVEGNIQGELTVDLGTEESNTTSTTESSSPEDDLSEEAPEETDPAPPEELED